MLGFIPASTEAFFRENPETVKCSRKDHASLANSVLRSDSNALFMIQYKQYLGDHGAEGKVKRGFSADGFPVAIKVINFVHENHRYEYYSEEIDILKKLGRFYGANWRAIDENTSRLYIMQTLIEGACLWNKLHLFSHGVFSHEQKLIVAMNLVKALMALEEQGIIHGDVKSENMIVDDELNITLVDFGFGKILPPGADYVQSLLNSHTPGYGAPEVIHDKIYSAKSDIHSLGITFKRDFKFYFPWCNAMLDTERTKRPTYAQVLQFLESELENFLHPQPEENPTPSKPTKKRCGGCTIS